MSRSIKVARPQFMAVIARVAILHGASAVGRTTLVGALRTVAPDTFSCYASDHLANEGFRPTASDAR